MIQKKYPLLSLKEKIRKEKQIIRELKSLSTHPNKSQNNSEKIMISSQIKDLGNSLNIISKELLEILDKINMASPLIQNKPFIKKAIFKKKEFFEIPQGKIPKQSKLINLGLKIPVKKEVIEQKPKLMKKIKRIEATSLEKLTLKRIGKKKKIQVRKEIGKPNNYITMANKMFSNYSSKLSKKDFFIP